MRKPKPKKRSLGKLRVATLLGYTHRQGNSRIPVYLLQFDTGKNMKWFGPLEVVK